MLRQHGLRSARGVSYELGMPRVALRVVHASRLLTHHVSSSARHSNNLCDFPPELSLHLRLGEAPEKGSIWRLHLMTPMQSLNPQCRDVAILLAHDIRIMSIDQIARTFFADSSNPCHVARRQMYELQRIGLVKVTQTIVHPEADLGSPLLDWTPGDPPPDFPLLAAKTSTRWTQSPAPTTLVHATRDAAKLFGGYTAGRVPRRTEVCHDLHLAQVYLNLRRDRPSYAKRWMSEQEQYARGGGRNERLPDAIIRGRRKPIDRIIEFAGSYSQAKLREMHLAFCHVPYELW